tara:strand:- start:465 stop:1049 length:585 start_codon:yes stop_codon:yes gene_type:complete
MEKLIGKNKIFCAVFISGRGSNLKSIYKYAQKKSSEIKIKLVVSDKSNAKGLIFAKKNKIKTKIVNYKNRNEAEIEIISCLKKNKIQLICLAGFMKILSKRFINSFKNKIINIHPSLLPRYKGLKTHERVIKYKEKFSGCTVHFVNEKLDAGKIILQQKVKINKSDTPKSLAKRILRVENKIYPRALKKLSFMI